MMSTELKALLVTSTLCIVGCVGSQANEDLDIENVESVVELEEVEAEEPVVTSGDTITNSDLTFFAFGGAGRSHDHTRGGEARSDSDYYYAAGTIRKHVGDISLDRNIRFEIGPHVRGSFSAFESQRTSRYEGEYFNAAAGLEFYFQDGFKNGSLPRFSLEVRALVGHFRSRGNDHGSTYRSKIKGSYVNLNGTLNLLWPFAEDSNSRYGDAANHRVVNVDGDMSDVHEGFTPKIELRADWLIAQDVHKSSTVTELGGRDPAYEGSFYGEVRWHFWRHATETLDTSIDDLWEVSYGPYLAMTWYKSSGMITMKDDHSVYEWQGGFFVEAALNRWLFLSGSVGATRGRAQNQDIRGQGGAGVRW